MDDATNKAVEQAEHRLAGRCMYCGAQPDIADMTIHKDNCNTIIVGNIRMLQSDISRIAGDLASLRSQVINNPNSSFDYELQDLVDSFDKISDVLQRRAGRSKTAGGYGNPF